MRTPAWWSRSRADCSKVSSAPATAAGHGKPGRLRRPRSRIDNLAFLLGEPVGRSMPSVLHDSEQRTKLRVSNPKVDGCMARYGDHNSEAPTLRSAAPLRLRMHSPPTGVLQRRRSTVEEQWYPRHEV